MKYQLISTALTAAVLMLGNSHSFAADNKAVAPQQAASKAVATKSTGTAKPKAAAKAKLVDINSASSGELIKLPGIGDAEAAKIIAGRPYGSKAWLVGHKILAEDKYPAIKDLIIAKQPYKDAAKNAALYGKKK
jgi:DNA uptake protein ComE-like DNA-binding protein